MPYLTPDAINPVKMLRLVLLSVEAGLIGAVDDALQQLAQTENWEQYGTLTVDEVTAYFTQVFLDYLESGLIGVILPYAAGACPSFALPCDGATYSKATNPEYSRLYDALDAVFIIDADQFVVPDFRFRVPVGADGTHLIGETGGEAEHTLEVSEMPAHTHDEGIAVSVFINGGLEAPASAALPAASITGSTGGGAPHNNLQPYLVVPYCIVFQ